MYEVVILRSCCRSDSMIPDGWPALNDTRLLKRGTSWPILMVLPAMVLSLDGNVDAAPQPDPTHKRPFMYPYNTRARNHQWIFTVTQILPLEYAYVGTISNAASGQCLDSNFPATPQSSGDKMQPQPFMWPCNEAAPNHNWKITTYNLQWMGYTQPFVVSAIQSMENGRFLLYNTARSQPLGSFYAPVLPSYSQNYAGVVAASWQLGLCRERCAGKSYCSAYNTCTCPDPWVGPNCDIHVCKCTAELGTDCTNWFGSRLLYTNCDGGSKVKGWDHLAGTCTWSCNPN